MRRVEIGLFCAAFAVSAFAQNNSAQTYSPADTFQPGKKYNCVPTADRKGWDCSETGKPVPAKGKEREAPPAATAVEPAPAPIESTPPPAAPQPSTRSTLPSYLTNAAASNPPPIEEPPSTVSAAAAHANAPMPVQKPVAAAPATPPPKAPTKTVPPKPVTPKASVAASPPPTRPLTKPFVAPRVTHPPVVEAASGGGEFMTLPGDHFVIEMAHTSGKSELDAVKTSTHVPNGELYEVRLRQNGADAWLLLWGSFDSLDAARAARNTISASATPGWPRRIAPLQAEARRTSP